MILQEQIYQSNIEYAPEYNRPYVDRVCPNCGKQLLKNNKYCNQKCQHEYEYKEYIEKWKNGEVDGIRGKSSLSYSIKKYIWKKYDNKCARCGWCEVNQFTGKSPLEVDHIDGKWKNNKEENLILLCPNCHSLTPTYKSLNKGNGREYRYLLKNPPVSPDTSNVLKG
jgi:predicted RNA-binding Zn-ribbon protein involved in translation (DUF1610 family)